MNWFSRTWRRLKILYLLLLPTRFSILALALASFAFIVADQGQDILRAVVEKDPQSEGPAWRLLILFVLLLNLLATQIWFWARQMLRLQPPRDEDDHYFGRSPNPEDPEHRPWALWVPRSLGALLYVALFDATWNIRCTYGEDVQTYNTTLLVLIAISFVLFLAAVIFRRRILNHRGDGKIEHISPMTLPAETKAILTFFIAAEILFFVLATARPLWLMELGAGNLVLMTLALWVPLGSAFVYLGIRTRIPIMAFLVVEAFLVSPLADRNHYVRNVTTPLPERPTVEAQLTKWYDRVTAKDYPPGTPIPIFIVATEGGGIRAAYWTAVVLNSLQDTVPNFRRNLFAVSSVSGGSLGTTVFTSLLADAIPNGSLHETGSKALGSDFLTPTLASMTQGDFVQRFLPFGFPDREKALETAWERGYRESSGHSTLSQGMIDLYAKHDDLPSIFLNGTMVETGDRIITSNCRIREQPSVAPPPDTPLLVFRDAFDGIDLLGNDIPMSAAAGMSARFTYVSPAGRIPRSSPLGHVVDGGYFENSGAVTAAELVQFIKLSNREHSWQLMPVVILIDYQDCGRGCSESTGTHKDCVPDANAPFPFRGTGGPANPRSADEWANEVLSPVRALLNTRGARGRQAVGDIRTSQQLPPPPEPWTKAPAVIEFRLVQRQVPIPLGWVLSLQASMAIDSAILSQGNTWSRNAVASWLSAAATTDTNAVQARDLLQRVITPAAPAPPPQGGQP